jgi:hypothetical protein
VARFREELLFGSDTEVIIAGRVGPIDSHGVIAGKRSKDFLSLSELIEKEKSRYPMIDQMVEVTPGISITARKKIDPGRDIYLGDHEIDSVPWLPAVMGIESFAEAARLLYPKMNIKALRNVTFLVPLKVLKNEPFEMTIRLKKKGVEGSDILLDASLEREFFNREGVKLGETRVHFQGEILLSVKKRTLKKMKGINKLAKVIERFKKNGEGLLKKEDVYTRFFHGPLFQVLESVIIVDEKSSLGAMAKRNNEIFSFTKKPELVTEPLVIETALQNSGIYAMANLDINSLPDSMEEIVFRSIPAKVKDLYVMSEFRGTDGEKQIYDTWMFDVEGNVYSILKGYRMIKTGALPEELKISFN